ncbi:MAG: pyridoxal-phosphate dependent enzyme, partial [Acidobacteriota bacterium]
MSSSGQPVNKGRLLLREKLSSRAFERLLEIPHLECGQYPTPLLEMRRLRSHLGGGPRLFIKHDDMTGPGFGGNKVRKLEYLLAQALSDDVEVVITVGAVRSNHARITAMLAARLGLRAILVLNSSNGSGNASSNGAASPEFLQSEPASSALGKLFGAEIYHVATREERMPTMQAIANDLRFAGRRVLEIPLGASIPIGALGYVRAAQEAARQLAANEVQASHFFHASSSGGTQAGLL